MERKLKSSSAVFSCFDPDDWPIPIYYNFCFTDEDMGSFLHLYPFLQSKSLFLIIFLQVCLQRCLNQAGSAVRQTTPVRCCSSADGGIRGDVETSVTAFHPSHSSQPGPYGTFCSAACHLFCQEPSLVHDSHSCYLSSLHGWPPASGGLSSNSQHSPTSPMPIYRPAGGSQDCHCSLSAGSLSASHVFSSGLVFTQLAAPALLPTGSFFYMVLLLCFALSSSWDSLFLLSARQACPISQEFWL